MPKGDQIVQVFKALSSLKELPSTVKIFSEKKNFTVDQARNRQNDRAVVKRGTPVPPICHTKHPAHLMVLGIVGSDGQKMPLYFFEEGLRVGAKALRYHVLPWLRKAYPKGNYVVQQDGAPGHTAKTVQEFLAKYFAMFWPKDMWPPQSPDLNPLDYGIWGIMDKNARATSHPNLASLKASVIREWDNLSMEFVANTCRQFRGRLEKAVEADGGYFE